MLQHWASSMPAHLALYNEVTVALDPFPYNGTTTTCEALFMGVPVVTLAGRRHSARVGASLLCRLGLPELVADDETAYVELAVGLARDHRKIAHLRKTLRTRMQESELCNGNRFAQNVEDVYRDIWRRWLEASRPRQPVRNHPDETK